MSGRPIISKLTALAVVLGLASLSVVNCRKNTVNPENTREESKLEQTIKKEDVTFEMAQRNPGLRQTYLNKIIADRQQYGTIGWESFADLIYDSEFKKADQKIANSGGNKNLNRIYGEGTENKFKPYMTTLFLGQRGVPLSVHVGERSFTNFASEDELLSALDNESFHAYLLHKSEAHLPINLPKKEMSMYVFNLMNEVYSFEKQFFLIETGRRQVSPKFINMFRPSARTLYKELVTVSKRNNSDGEFARCFLEAIQNRPTIKYFK